jgi:hypothetical protein
MTWNWFKWLRPKGVKPSNETNVGGFICVQSSYTWKPITDTLK